MSDDVIDPNPQWLWRKRRAEEMVRCRLIQLADRFEVSVWKGPILTDVSPHATLEAALAEATTRSADYEADGWTRAD